MDGKGMNITLCNIHYIAKNNMKYSNIKKYFLSFSHIHKIISHIVFIYSL